jgi:hypothetical protein
LIVTLFLFLPQIDRANLARRQGLVNEEVRRYKRWEQEQLKKEKEDPSKALDADAKKKALEAHEKKKLELEDDLAAAEVTAATRPYWYQFGDLLGLVVLAVGCVAYLSPRQGPPRRLIGGVVLVLILLWVFQHGFFVGFIPQDRGVRPVP